MHPKRQGSGTGAKGLRSLLVPTIKSLGTLALAITSAELWRFSLTPVYGSMHLSPGPNWLFVSARAVLFRILTKAHESWGDRTKVMVDVMFSIMGCAMPTIASGMFRVSGLIGPGWGFFLLVEVVASFLLLLAVLKINRVFEKAEPYERKQSWPLPESRRMQDVVQYVLEFILHFSYASLREKVPEVFQRLAGTSPTIITDRFGLQVVLAFIYATLDGSRMLFIKIPLLGLALTNQHVPLSMNTARLNSTLNASGFSIVARQESLTGYISVVDNLKGGYRVMRCDHSLLGGEWLNPPTGYSSILPEPIFAVFIMLEAVRLVEKQVPTAAILERKEEALVIGVGIGTAPSALIAHGIETTTIELDPVVHSHATKYFHLPSNQTSIIGDAINSVKPLQKAGLRYDYIIHDVFTGGSEPLALFTYEFLQDLKELLHEDGTIAINYGGDILLPPAITVFTTILTTFSSCRFYRETPLPPQPQPLTSDIINLVIFCRKTPSKFSFRPPIEADFLGSQLRKQHLFPRYEMDVVKEGGMLHADKVGGFAEWQRKGAEGHWYLMRGLLPGVFWENW